MIKALLIATTVLFSGMAQARAVECRPIQGENWTPWKTASITQFAGSSQYLFHIRARGGFYTADLLCNIEECLGFINNHAGRGKIVFAADESYQPIGLVFTTDDGTRPPAGFNCQ